MPFACRPKQDQVTPAHIEDPSEKDQWCDGGISGGGALEAAFIDEMIGARQNPCFRSTNYTSTNGTAEKRGGSNRENLNPSLLSQHGIAKSATRSHDHATDLVLLVVCDSCKPLSSSDTFRSKALALFPHTTATSSPRRRQTLIQDVCRESWNRPR